MFPEVRSVKEYVMNVSKKMKIEYIFDMHGHSSKRNIFAYG